MASNNEVKTKFTADSSGFTAAVDRANQRISQYAASTGRAKEVLDNFQKALEESGASTAKQVQQIANAVTQMDRMAASAGKTQAQLAAMKSEGLGISAAMQGYVAQIEAATQHTHSLGLESTATRRELLVLAHEASQGNWKRFGGSLLVLGETMDATRLLMNPFTIALVAVGGAAYLMYHQIEAANERVKAFHEAMNTTSGYAGQTRESIQGLAEALSARFGVGVGEATDNLNALVATGRASADVFPQIATVATAMAKSTGEAFDKVLDNLLKQQTDVKKAADEYQASRHTMTDADLALIDSLEKTGQKHEAFTILIQRELDDLAMSTKSHTSEMASYWDTVTAAAQRYMRALTGNSTDLDKLNDLKARQAAQQSGKTANYDYTDYGPLIAAQQKIVDANKADQAAADKNNKTKVLLAESQAEVAKQVERTLSPQQKLSEALQRDNAIIDNRIKLLKESGQYTAAAQAQLEAQRKQMLDYDTQHITPPKKQHSNNNALNGQIAELNTSLKGTDDSRKEALENLKGELDKGLIDYREYYVNVIATNEKYYKQEEAIQQKRIDLAKQRGNIAAAQAAQQELNRIEHERVAAAQKASADLGREYEKRALATAKYAEQAAAGTRNQADGYAKEDATRFMTPQQKTDYAGELKLREDYYKEVEKLKEQYDSKQIDQQEWDDRTKIAAQAFSDREELYKEHLEKEQAIRNSYQGQITLALTNIAGQGKTNAQYVGDAFTSVWGTMSSALDNFVTTGQFNFKQFTASVLEDMAKIALHAAEMQIFQSVLGSTGMSFFSTGGAVGHYADGGHISGPGSGTSDSIPAMLSNGEFVVNAAATSKHRSLLESINSGQAAHFASGGAVGDAPASSSSSGGSPVSVTVHNNGGGGLTEQDAKDIHAVVKALIDKRMDQRMRGQGGYAYQQRYNQI